jgi:ATP-binding cassette subfamily B protein
MKERRKKSREAHDAASAFISDVADAALAIKTTGSTDAVLRKYDDVNANRRTVVMKDIVFNERVSALLNGAVCVGSAVMMFMAARLMGGNSFGIGDFSLFIAHLGTFADCTNRMVELVYEARKAEVSYERIADTADIKNAKQLSAGADIELRRTEEVPMADYPVEAFSSFEVRSLCYTYSGEDGFRDVSFSLRPGKMIAVAGGMASGKSTLLSVLMGLMPPDCGEILWDGHSVESLSDRISRCIAGSPQRGGFFLDDIKTNLCLDVKADDSRIAEALRVAALGDILSSEEALSKTIGDHGDKLSGGQRQRLALARTILRGASVCVIDDCISALDEDTRKKVLYSLTDYL